MKGYGLLIFLVTALVIVYLHSGKRFPPIQVQNESVNQVCKAKSEYSTYVKAPPSPSKQSDYLTARLQEYEQMHSRCTAQGASNDCKYVVFVPSSFNGPTGVGNKIISIASTFLYGLLTNRAIYIPPLDNLDRLFCNPFPHSSWHLPDSLDHVARISESIRLGKLVEHGPATLPDVLFAELSDYWKDSDKVFFTDEQQKSIASNVTWLAISTDQYFTPALLSVPSFREELTRLFPDQESIFHLLGRYLIYPSDAVWEKATKFYNDHLSQADLVVGVQMRVNPTIPMIKDPKTYPDFVFDCLSNQVNVTGDGQHVALLVVSLFKDYYDTLKKMFESHRKLGSLRVTVHQPSHEGAQRTGNLDHDEKALTEVFLLSFSDVLVTSPISTFGYAAQGLKGVRPWCVACMREDGPVCSIKPSMEPCYHTFPTQMMVDNVQACECGLGYMLKPSN